MLKAMRPIYLLLIIGLFGLMLLTGCDNSSSDESGSSESDSRDGGTVALYLGDGPADDFDNIWIEVSQISLLSEDDGQPVVIYESDNPERIDLLTLRDDDLLMSVNPSVAAGRYSKIRLTVDAIEGQQGDQLIDFNLTCSKIDINLKDEVEIIPGESLSLRVDIDVDKSIQSTGSGYTFRPTVFVDSEEIVNSRPSHHFIKGEIIGFSFPEIDGEEVDVLQIVPFNGTIDLDVYLQDDVVIYDESGQSVMPDALAVNQMVSVKGQLDADGRFWADQVIIGKVRALSGMVETAVDDQDQFQISLSCRWHPLVNDDGLVSVAVSEDTTIMLGDMEVDASQIQPGMKVRVVGISITDTGAINALDIRIQPRRIVGKLTALDTTGEVALATIKPTKGYGWYGILLGMDKNSAKCHAENRGVTIAIPDTASLEVKGGGALTLDDLAALIECRSPLVKVLVSDTEVEGAMAQAIALYVKPYRKMVVVKSVESGVITDQNGKTYDVSDETAIWGHNGKEQRAISIEDIEPGDILFVAALKTCSPTYYKAVMIFKIFFGDLPEDGDEGDDNGGDNTSDPDETEDPDTDGDGISDAEDTDDDNDGTPDADDVFPSDPDEQADADADGVGDNEDTDDDNDGTPDVDDAFPFDPNEQADADSDGVGDNEDTDDDNDGTPDAEDLFPMNSGETTDSDGDGTGDNADPDDDNDGVDDNQDAFPTDPSESEDNDGDGTGDNADPDDDNDGVDDKQDAFPNDPTETTDTDNDGIGNNADEDDDGDSVLDGQDAFPLDPEEDTDTDGDEIGNNADSDDDGDGVLDVDDAFPLDSTETLDTDGDGIGNNADSDDDGDGVLDVDDAFPLDSTETLDTDGDEIGDNADTDDDNDGTPDADDVFPTDPDEWADADSDGVGDNADPDDDNDGVEDEEDACPEDPNLSTLYKRIELTNFSFPYREDSIEGKDADGYDVTVAITDATVYYNLDSNGTEESVLYDNFVQSVGHEGTLVFYVVSQCGQPDDQLDRALLVYKKNAYAEEDCANSEINTNGIMWADNEEVTVDTIDGMTITPTGGQAINLTDDTVMYTIDGSGNTEVLDDIAAGDELNVVVLESCYGLRQGLLVVKEVE